MKLKEAEIQRQRQLKKLKNEIVQQPNLKVNLSNYTFTSDGKPLVIEGVKNLRPNVACLLNAAEKPSRGLRSAGLIKHRMQRRQIESMARTLDLQSDCTNETAPIIQFQPTV
jgi:hypothetical protein